MRKPMVIGFVAENAHGALEASAGALGLQFMRQGYAAATINLLHPGCFDLLRRFAADHDIAFCYGYAGIGAHMQGDGMSLWEKTRIPFLSLMYDHPFYHPLHHSVPSKYVCNCYAIQDFFEVQRDYIRSPQPSTQLRISSAGYPYLYNAPRECWNEREIEGVFLKSGYNLSTLGISFDIMPPAYRSVTWDCIRAAQKNADLMLTDLVRDALAGAGIDYRQDEKIWDDFVYIVRVIDMYMRHWRSNQLVENLKHLPIVIVGNGWDHIDKSSARAIFKPAMPMLETKKLLKMSKFILNTHPYARYAWHERVFFGFELGLRVISDRTRFTDMHFADLPSFMGFDWSDSDQFRKVEEHMARFRNKYFDFIPVQQRLGERFPPDATRTHMLDIAREIRRTASV